VANEFKVAAAKQMGDVGLLAREEVVNADDVVAHAHEPLTEMAS